MTRSGSSALGLRLLLAVAMLTIVSTATVAVVYAHAEPDRSLPEVDSVIPNAPDRVEVWFTQELFRREGANTLVVQGPDGTRVDRGEPLLDSADREHLSVELDADLPDGVYTVHWTTLSAIDGDAAEGSFTFTIDPTAPEPVATEAGAATAVTTTSDGTPAGEDSSDAAPALLDDGSAFPWWAVIAAAAILISGALAAWALVAAGPAETRDA